MGIIERLWISQALKVEARVVVGACLDSEDGLIPADGYGYGLARVPGARSLDGASSAADRDPDAGTFGPASRCFSLSCGHWVELSQV
jgi:hypothetical protein